MILLLTSIGCGLNAEHKKPSGIVPMAGEIVIQIGPDDNSVKIIGKRDNVIAVANVLIRLTSEQVKPPGETRKNIDELVTEECNF